MLLINSVIEIFIQIQWLTRITRKCTHRQRIAPFDFISSRSHQAASLESRYSLTNFNYKEARKSWLAKLEVIMRIQCANISKSQQRYKRNFDNRLGKQRNLQIERVWVYIRWDYAKSDEGCMSKLAPTVDGPYYVLQLRDTSAFIKIREILRRWH